MRPSNIQLQFWSHAVGNHIDVSIRQDESIEVMIKGKDSLWVNGLLAQITNLIQSFPPQVDWKKQYYPFGHVVTAVGTGYVALQLLGLFFSKDTSNPSETGKALEQFSTSYPAARYVVRYLFSYLIGALFFTGSIRRQLSSLYPSIEIYIGPEHEQSEKLRRRKLAYIFTVIIIPILITLVIEIARAF